MSDKGYKGGEVNTAIAQAYAGSFVDTLGRRGDVMEKTAKETVLRRWPDAFAWQDEEGSWFVERSKLGEGETEDHEEYQQFLDEESGEASCQTVPAH